MKLYVEISDAGINIITKEGFKVSNNSTCMYLYMDNDLDFILPDLIDVNTEDFMKQNKGILIKKSETFIEIFNDPFCSVPLYLFQNDNTSIVTTDFLQLSRYIPKLEIDRVGLNEMIIFGNCIYDRTLFEGIKQLPAASKFIFDLKGNECIINNYWNFNIYLDKNIKNELDATEVIHNILKEIFSKYKDKEIHMGLSGGLDSRMSLCLLKDVINKNSLNCFTFGYNSHILEYKFAKKIARYFNLRKPLFYKLTVNKYLQSFELPIRTGGQIGINHSHIYSYLASNTFQGIFISNYYSDAAMGWDAKREKESADILKLSYYQKLESNNLKLSKEDKSNIIDDLYNVIKRYDEKANFSGLEEFFYVTERNPKFHVRLSFEFGDLVQTELPYADYKLLVNMISLPLEYRYEKKIEQNIVNKYSSMNDVSSRRYFERSNLSECNYSKFQKLYYNLRNKQFKLFSSINNKLFGLSNGKIQVIDPFQTENQLAVVIRSEKLLIKALDELYKRKIISEQFKDSLLDDSNKRNMVDTKLFLLSIWSCLEAYKK